MKTKFTSILSLFSILICLTPAYSQFFPLDASFLGKGLSVNDAIERGSIQTYEAIVIPNDSFKLNNLDIPRVIQITGERRPLVGHAYYYYRAILNVNQPNLEYSWTVPVGASFQTNATGDEIKVQFSSFGIGWITCRVNGMANAFPFKVEMINPVPEYSIYTQDKTLIIENNIEASETDLNKYSYTIANIHTGQTVQKDKLVIPYSKLDISLLKPGIYVINIFDKENRKFVSQKFTVK